MNETHTHLDLFSGIGGFALAAGWAGFRTIGFCDNEPFAQGVLKKNWPGVPIHSDIKNLNGKEYAGITLLTGGFPCQPFSCAGKRRGTEDDRHLWPQMLRIIQEARPSWIVGENVAGIIGMELDQICVDLENQGYQVEAIVIPACSVDAPHRRDRVWIVGGGGEKMAYTESIGASQNWANREQIPYPQTTKRLPGCDNARGGNEKWKTESNLDRMADGIPNWTHRIKGLGNAIVPQVAFQILKRIKYLCEN